MLFGLLSLIFGDIVAGLIGTLFLQGLLGVFYLTL
jgi:hypothetical protein